MTTRSKTTLLAALTLTLAAGAAPAQDAGALAGPSGLEPGTPFVLYLGDADGTPREVVAVGDIPLLAERRLLIPVPVPQDRRLSYFLAVRGQRQPLALPTFCRTTDPGGCPALENRGAWTGGVHPAFQQGLAGENAGAVLGDPGVEIEGDLRDPPVEVEQPFAVGKKPQHEVGRLRRTLVSGAGDAAGATLGAADDALALGDQATGLDMVAGYGPTISLQASAGAAAGGGEGAAAPGGPQMGLGFSAKKASVNAIDEIGGENGPRHHFHDTVRQRSGPDTIADLQHNLVTGTASLGQGTVVVGLSAQDVYLLMDL